MIARLTYIDNLLRPTTISSGCTSALSSPTPRSWLYPDNQFLRLIGQTGNANQVEKGDA